MDLRQLRTFVAISEHGTVSQAARILHITQPALSRQIAGLEAEFGFELFERVGRRLRLTARGEQLLGDCRSLLACAGALRERAQALGRGDIKVLKVAASALTIEGAFPTFLERYAESVAGVELMLIERDDPAEHLSMLERGEVHLSVNVVNSLKIDDERFARYVLPRFHVAAVCARSRAIERSGAIDIRQLARHPLLLLNASFATRSIFDAACRLAGVTPNALVESRSVHALLALAEAGRGVAIVPSILRPSRREFHVMRVMHKREPLYISLAVLWDKRRTLPRHAERFSELLTRHMRQTFPDSHPARNGATGARRGAVNSAASGRELYTGS